MKKSAGIAGICVFAASFTAAAFYCGLVVRKYEVKSNKLKKPVRLLLISDLHSCRYGEKQTNLISRIQAQKPDAIVIAGDLFDDRLPTDGTIEFLNGIKREFPCYYASGNHECYTGKLDLIKDMLRSYGINILAGNSRRFTANGQMVSICGVDDPKGGEYRFKRQLKSLKRHRDKDVYTVCLSHRPELIRLYEKCGFDLVLTGHAHGGQWRLPYLINGVIAPNQGLFPKYAGGEYRYDGGTMIVGRGLARESTPIIPRIFNPPELVVIDLLPESRQRGRHNGLKKT